MAYENCRTTNINANNWCLKNLYSLGEGTDLIFLPAPLWGAIRQRWMQTPSGSESNNPNVLTLKQGATLMEYIYNEPTTTPETTLFTNGDSEKEGLFFSGNALIFTPTVGNAIEADGTPYQSSSISLPMASSKEFDELIQYLQSKAWVGLKLNHDGTILHVYGGPRGYFPVADEVAEMLYSGNNDAKGKTSAAFSVDKANYAIEYLILGEQTTNKDALKDLMGYIKDGACKPNGNVEPSISVEPVSLSFTQTGESKSFTVTATGAYIVTSKPEWITIDENNATATANSETEARNGSIIFALLGNPDITAVMSVTQPGTGA